MARVVVAAALVAFSASSSYGQSAGPKPASPRLEFEVASIKPSAPPAGRGVFMPGGRGGPGSNDPGRVTYNLTSLRDLLVNAYGIKHNQISGEPDWLDTQRFYIVAKVPEGATKEQVKIMLQNLLADRFKLAVHRETKEMPMYALAVAGKGPKLKETTVSDAPPPSDPSPKDAGPRFADLGPRRRRSGWPPPLGRLKMGADGCPETPPMLSGRAGNFQVMTPFGACMIVNGQSMSGFADQLSNQFDRPVVDMTGLKGKYDFKLRFDPSSIPSTGGRGMMKMGPPGAMPAGGRGGDVAVAPEDREPAPSIFAAMQEQARSSQAGNAQRLGGTCWSSITSRKTLRGKLAMVGQDGILRGW